MKRSRPGNRLACCLFHYGNAIWPSWCLVLPVNQVFVQQFVQNSNKETPKSALLSHCERNPPQEDSNAENVSIWWRHNVVPSHYGSKCCPDVSWNLNQNIIFIKENGFESVVCYISAILSWWGMGWTWCHAIETFLALLGLCEGNPPITVVFLSQRAGNVTIW